MAQAHHICTNCEHWNGSVSGIGRCCRFPPSIPFGVDGAYVNGVLLNSDWPITQKDDWCGEFKCKDSPLYYPDLDDPADPAISAAG